MPNRYIPSALLDIIEEERDAFLVESETGKGDDDGDEYVSEWQVLVERMLKPEYAREFRRRRGELDDG